MPGTHTTPDELNALADRVAALEAIHVTEPPIDPPIDPPPPTGHSYFDLLSALPSMVQSWSMNQEQLDIVKTAGKGNPANEPIVYDPTADAARTLFRAGGSFSSQQKRFPLAIRKGDVFITWDCWLGASFRYQDGEFLKRHKTFQLASPSSADWPLGGDRWMVWKTDYRGHWDAPPDGHVAETYMGIGGNQTFVLGPGTSKNGEIIEPRSGKFFLAAETWTRYAISIEGLGGEFVSVSVWLSDEHRDPVQIYDRVSVKLGPDGLSEFWLEWNTSQDQEGPTRDRVAYQRNLVALVNAGDVTPFLVRP